MTLSDTILTRYPGEYMFDSTSSLLIRRIANHLEMKGKDEQEWNVMYFTQDIEFFVFSNRLRYIFSKENGNPLFDTLLLTNGQRSVKARKKT